MKKVNEILHNRKYSNALKELNELEKDREFCKHTIEHFLDVSRIAYIKVLEGNLNYTKEVIYAIGLLHDIGRVLEYKENIPHHLGSVILAKEILKETSYSENEKKIIIDTIKNHRNEEDDELSLLIYKSDKLSRNCFSCSSEKECYWSREKKNFNITY